jgi:hypothetical protein
MTTCVGGKYQATKGGEGCGFFGHRQSSWEDKDWSRHLGRRHRPRSPTQAGAALLNRYNLVGAGLPAMDFNENACIQNVRVVSASFASKLRSYRKAMPVQFEKVAQCNGKKPTC